MEETFSFCGQPHEVEDWFLPDNVFTIARSTSHKQTARHVHNHMQLWYVLRGSFRHVLDDQDFIQSAGDFVFVPTWCSHIIDTSAAPRDVSFIFCDLSDGFLNIFPNSAEKRRLFDLAYLRPLLVNARKVQPFLSFSGNSRAQLEAGFFDLIREYESNSELSQVYLRAGLLRLFALVAREYEARSPSGDDALFAQYRAAIQSALDYIDLHYTEDITLPEISKIALMSVRSFSSVFKSITGKTFLEYVHYLRIRRARNLLLETSMSLTAICFECGFRDITHFGRVFKKIAGETPGAYRKRRTYPPSF